MAPRSPRRRWTGWRVPLVAMLIVVIALYLGAHPERPGYSFALGWLVIGLAITGVALLVRRFRGARPKRQRANVIVSVCIRRPILPVPTLAEAYRALPVYCRQLL